MQSSLVTVILLLSVWGVSEMIAREDGPANLFQDFRNLYVKPNWVGRGIRCPKCLSFWFGALGAAITSSVYFNGELLPFFGLWFASLGFVRLLLIGR